MRFHKILVALDFSEPSRNALTAACEEAAVSGAELVLLHIWQPVGYAYAGPEFPLALVESYQRQARQSLDEWKRAAEQVGVKRVTTKLLTGTPWHEIVEVARDDKTIDLIMLGTHGHTGLRHALLGSVAERIVRHAPCPVLVMRNRAND